MIPGKIKVKLSPREAIIIRNACSLYCAVVPANSDYRHKLYILCCMPLYKRFSVALLFPKTEMKFSIPVVEALSFLILFTDYTPEVIPDKDDLVVIRQFISIIDKAVI